MDAGHIAQDNDRPSAVGLRIGQARAVNAEEAPTLFREEDVALCGSTALQRLAHELLQTHVADDLFDIASLSVGRVDAQQLRGGVVDAYNPTVRIHRHHPFEQTGENRLHFVPLLGYGANSVLELGGHFIERLGQLVQLGRPSLGDPDIELALREQLRDALHARDGLTDPA
jgi:hypothetical protein